MKKSIFGMLLTLESLFLAFVLAVAVYYHYTLGETDWKAFAWTTAITFLTGTSLTAYGHTKYGRTQKQLTRGGSFIIVGMTWVVFSAFGMLPFIFYEGLDVDFASAYFETMSGFSTMGATIIPDIESMPHGILLWRSLMQWMGGLGIVVFSFALLPVRDMKNSTMFIAEMSGLTINRLQPKIGATSRRLLLIYLVLTLVCILFFWVGPMNLFDALCFSLSTIATGGYGTHTANIGYFHSAYVEYVCALFMLASSVNFGLYYYLSIFRGRDSLKNEEVRAFALTVVGFVALFCLLFRFTQFDGSVAIPHTGEDIFRTSLFHVATIISSSGFQAQAYDYVGWGQAFWMPTVVMMIIGGCTVSTAGGIKMMRVLIYLKYTLREFRTHLHPNAIIGIKFNGRVIADRHIRRVMSFLVIYVLLLIVSCVLMTMFMGFDLTEAFGAAVSSLGNTGPALGSLGPSGNFVAVPAAGKLLLSFLMLVGRLEIFTVLFLFMPKAWKI
ncbi:MAG: TrkH family potassium uptake protein [Bacteroidaceae bacterium]|nr:TrkH family potassium uptake protein [Bacteroidaceae bacterium]